MGEGEGVRLSPDELFLEMCVLVSSRGTCLRAQVGAVIVQDRRVVSMGYNGAPPGLPHCTEVGCDPDIELFARYRAIGIEPAREKALMDGGCHRAIHAEANAIAWAARHGTKLFGATMYCTYSPCQKCAELILSAGIGRFVYAKSYRAKRLDLLRSIEVCQIPEKELTKSKKAPSA